MNAALKDVMVPVVRMDIVGVLLAMRVWVEVGEGVDYSS